MCYVVVVVVFDGFVVAKLHGLLLCIIDDYDANKYAVLTTKIGKIW